VQGPGNRIIAYERILLNFIQKLSGVATLTKSFVDTLANKKIQILDTRKTTPGWRHLEKYAVVVGGGKNHRMNLAESILIKDNHIKFCEGIEVVLDKIEKSKTNLRIEVEVSSLNELEKIVKFNINQIMLDNFKIREISKAIKMIRSTSKAKIELSGNIKQKDLKSLSSYDIDFISIGKLTHSAPFLDISMNVLR
jgi:nicotinate-nucleotide pyrophosphorylase (carboxylating)